MKELWIIAAILLVLIPLGMWWFSPEQVIMRRTKHLMEVLMIDWVKGDDGWRFTKVIWKNL